MKICITARVKIAAANMFGLQAAELGAATGGIAKMVKNPAMPAVQFIMTIKKHLQKNAIGRRKHKMVGHDAPNVPGEWRVYEFACPDCGTEVRASIFYRTDRDDGGWRASACEPGLHAVAQPTSHDRRSNNPRLNCYVKSEQA